MDDRDRNAIHDLVSEYADAVNASDPDRLSQLFTRDGVWNLGAIGIETGRSAIAHRLTELLRGWEVLIHVPHSGTLRQASEASLASGWWYFSEFGLMRTGESAHFAGVYHDDYVRLGSRWHFRTRRYHSLFRRRGSEVAASPFPARDPKIWPSVDKP